MFNIKKYLKEKKENRKREKELARQVTELIKEEEEDENLDKITIYNILDVIKDDVDEEYKSLLSEEELKEYLEQKEKEKKFTIKMLSIFSVLVVLAGIVTYILFQVSKSQILKVTLPIMENYYMERYNQKLKYQKIEELITKDEENKDVKSGIYLATTKDNKHIISINNETLGDDISTGEINTNFLEMMKDKLYYSNMVDHAVEISYKPYLPIYNRYIEYANSIPYKKNLDELLSEKNLIVTYKIIYQGDINSQDIYEIMNQVSDESSFYLLKVEAGLPKKLTIITSKKYYEMPITNSVEKEEGIYYFQLDSNINNISNMEYATISGNSISTDKNYVFTSGFYIKTQQIQRRYDKNEDRNKYSNHTLIRFKSNSISPSSMVQIEKRNLGYEETNIENYKEIIFMTAGGYTYLITESQEIKLGMKGTKKSFLCNIGIC